MATGDSDTRDGFQAIPVRSLRAGTAVPADIYVRTAPRQYALHKARHSIITPEAIAALKRKKQTIYVTDPDTESYYDYIEDNLRSVIRDCDRTDADVPAFIYESTEMLMEQLWSDVDVPAAIRRLSIAAEATVSTILNNKNTLWDMLAIAGHDYYTYTHSINVSAILIAAGSHILDLDRDGLKQMGTGGMLHDLGKKRISGQILKKPGTLTSEEFTLIMKHPIWGIQLAEERHILLSTARQIITSHHERYEGTGYPTGRPARGMPETSRLAKIVDVYDAITTHRPYRRASPSVRALKIMQEEMRGHFDAKLLHEFIMFLGLEGSLRDMPKLRKSYIWRRDSMERN